LNDESYIQIALEIAKKGMGKVSPNPLVGCLIEKNGKIIGAGYHQKFGGKHAEINAIESAIDSLEGSTMYVNLEPCSHYGKTPPCVDKIIESKIKRVVIGTLDMNPLVSGKGIKKLKNAGVEVKVGLLEKECIELNKFFFKYITKKVPFVTLKIAQTLDGKIADHNKDSKWITSISSRRKVHSLRSQYDAVLIGSGTVKKDDPALTVRLTEGRNPKRIILDSKLNITIDHKIFKVNNDKNTFIVTSEKSSIKSRKVNSLLSMGVNVIFVDEDEQGNLDLKQTLRELAKRGIASVLVEGGSKIFTSFIKNNLFDEILLFVSPKLLGSGLSVVGDIGIKTINKVFKLQIKNVEKIGEDVLIELIK
jgi:diaminohydroxyphosphoribosylaminopyrimidine deaminase/5-amino-6-(5-phosphoribosylamino)uracil reductase